MYLLDTSGNLYGPNSKTNLLLSGVSYAAPTVDGHLYAISSSTTTSPSADVSGVWDTQNNVMYKMFSSAAIRQIELVNEKPIQTNPRGLMTGYNGQCVTDFSAGVDGTVWALDCKNDNEGNFDVIKWDPFVGQWYVVQGAKGVKISAFNEVSAAVLDAQGRIYVSSDTGTQTTVQYYPRPDVNPTSVSTPSPTPIATPSPTTTSTPLDARALMLDSTILNDKSRLWVKSLFSSSYNTATLCWRATSHGFKTSDFHRMCDKKGPTISIIKATSGRTFGGFTSKEWDGGSGFKAEPEAYLF